MSTEAYNPAWEIATACDITLARFFTAGAPCEGQVLEISEPAISEVIQAMRPSHKAHLLFTAGDITSKKFADLRGTLAYCREGSTSSDTETREIGVGINNMNVIDNLRYFFGANQAGLHASRPLKPALLQRRSIHELQHAVDSTDHDLMELDLEERILRSEQDFARSHHFSTFERRARQAELTADDYPQIISIV